MAKFKVSAPGRIFLSGEHTKMYEKNVITAGLNLRTTLTFSELPDENINIKFPDVKLSLILPIEQILNFFYDEDLNLRCNNTRRLLEHVQFFITSNGMWSTYEQKHSLQIFLFLLLWSSKSENFDIRPFHVHVTTQLPMNAGFGSSTSFAVCLAGCFLHWSRLQKGLSNDQLHTIYTIAQNYGYMEKLSGLGHACILLPLNIHEDSIESSRNISDDLIMEGFAVTRTSVNCDGKTVEMKSVTRPKRER
ncbi:uncharacterized protein [Anoplolepis gracilipes]|uniref:uncharacterized protein isoform X3 n=1 Tax=Anoplolepis gracilipes TaxID=354296 RepID=UPI003BA324AF